MKGNEIIKILLGDTESCSTCRFETKGDDEMPCKECEHLYSSEYKSKYTSVCDDCEACKKIKETRFEPEEYYCSEEMENFGTAGGCYQFTERREDCE